MTPFRGDRPDRQSGQGFPSAPSQRVSGLQNLNIALLIDFDNVILGVEDPGFDIELVVDALRERGIIVLGRAYGDWYRHNRHRRKLMEHGIELVETPVFGPLIKNSADIRIVLDGFEIAMTQHHIDAFCLVSGDSDFLPLIKKLQYLGKHVIVIAGNKFTSDLVRRNCNEFISYENLYAESFGIEDATTLDGAYGLLQRALVTLSERGMEARSSAVKQMMVQLNAAFSERNFGYAQFRSFLDRAARSGVVKLSSRGSNGEAVVSLPDMNTANGNGANGTNGTPAIAAPVVATTTPIDAVSTDIAPVADLGEPTVDPATSGRRRRRRRKPGSIEEAEAVEVTSDTVADAIADQEATVTQDAAAALEVAPFTFDETTQASTETAPAANLPALTMGSGTNLLLGANVRRGRLRFTGKAGRAQVVAPNVPANVDPVEVGLETREAVIQETTNAEQDDTPDDALALTVNVSPPQEETERAPGEATAGESSEALSSDEAEIPQLQFAPVDELALIETGADIANADANEAEVTDAIAEADRATATAPQRDDEIAVLNAMANEAQAGVELTPDAVPPAIETALPIDVPTEEPTTPKRPSRRRRKSTATANADANASANSDAAPDATTAVGERSLPATAPADEAEAAHNEADAVANDVSIPGDAYDIATPDDLPSQDVAPVAVQSETVNTSGDPTPDPTDARPLVATEADAGAVAAVDEALSEVAKPKRTRRGGVAARACKARGNAENPDNASNGGALSEAGNGTGAGGESPGSQSASGSAPSSAGGEA